MYLIIYHLKIYQDNTILSRIINDTMTKMTGNGGLLLSIQFLKGIGRLLFSKSILQKVKYPYLALLFAKHYFL